MRASRVSLVALLLGFILFISCNKIIIEKTDELAYGTERLNELLPLQVGQYVTYRLDSTIFTQFGTVTETHSYQEKNIIDAQLLDASGRPSYRVYRFIRDTDGIEAWKSAGSYFITTLSDQVELVENNLRFIKLHLPIKTDFSWHGNAYLNDNPYSQFQGLQSDDFMTQWKYTYKNINDTFLYNQQKLNVVTVLQVDEETNPVDTVDVISNKASIPSDSSIHVWLRGSATDTITINSYKDKPALGRYENLTIYNRTSQYAKLNGILIPPGLSLFFQYSNNKWYYPNPLTVASNKISIPSYASLAYIVGTASDSIKVNVSNIDTSQTKTVTIYNKSNFDAYCNFPGLNTINIPPGFGRTYTLREKEWSASNFLHQTDPYSSDFPFGDKSYSVEKYAKGIGLIYQELILWEYQPNSGGQGGNKDGFGVKRSMIDHN